MRYVSPNSIVSMVAGNGMQGYAGDGGTATAAQLHGPHGLVAAPDDTLYIVDTLNHRSRAAGPSHSGPRR